MKVRTGPYSLILCIHDLAPDPVARGPEIKVWMPFAEFSALYGSLDKATRQNGVRLELTSDDAFASDYELLFPWLIENGLKATFFIPTGFVGRPGRLTWAHIREMQTHGMRIETHGTDHIDWVHNEVSAVRQDIMRSIETLQQTLGQEVRAAAPPFGSYNRTVLQILRGAGVEEIYTADGGYAAPAGVLRTRFAIERDPTARARLRSLSERRPASKDWLRSRWHHVRVLLRA